MRIKIIQKIIDKLRGKPVRFYAIDPKVSIGKGTFVDSNSTVGDYTSMMEYCSVTSATIGRYCAFADFVTIGAGEHNPEYISIKGMLREGFSHKELTEKPCTIGNDVWIGVDSIVRRGVTIGNCAIIGANSFVNKDVPPFAIVGGNPARIIRYRFDKATRAKILESKYWEDEPETARQKVKELQYFYDTQGIKNEKE